jgi:hypothetical protein
MRGFKRDETETKAAYTCKALVDKRKRSFIGRKPDGSLHLMLAGEDKTRMWDQIMTRDRSMCRGCPTAHYVGAFGEWDHMHHKTWDRCDCAANGRCVCSAFHLRRHVVRFREEFKPCRGVLSFVRQAVA